MISRALGAPISATMKPISRMPDRRGPQAQDPDTDRPATLLTRHRQLDQRLLEDIERPGARSRFTTRIPVATISDRDDPSASSDRP